MNSANTLYLAHMANEATAPCIVEKNGAVMYIGYCAPDCRGVTDKKWMIKRVLTRVNDDIETQTITYSNGSRKMNVAWNDRASLTYRPNESFTSGL